MAETNTSQPEIRLPFRRKLARLGKRAVNRLSTSPLSAEIVRQKQAKEQIIRCQLETENLPTPAAQLSRDFRRLLDVRPIGRDNPQYPEVVQTTHEADAQFDGFESRQRLRIVPSGQRGPDKMLAGIQVEYDELGESPFVHAGQLDQLEITRFTGIDRLSNEPQGDRFEIKTHTVLPPFESPAYVEHRAVINPAEDIASDDTVVVEFTYFGSDNEERPTVQITPTAHELEELMQIVSNAAHDLVPLDIPEQPGEIGESSDQVT